MHMAMIKLSMDNQQIDVILQCQQFDMDKHFSFATDDDLSGKSAYIEVETLKGSCIETEAKITSNHIITIYIDPNITWKKGSYKFNVVVYDKDKTNRASYPTMTLRVNESANPNADAEGITAIETTLNNLKDGVYEVIESCNQAIKKADTATNNSQLLYDKLKDLTVADFELRIQNCETNITTIDTWKDTVDAWKESVLAGTEPVLIEDTSEEG